VNCGIPRIEVRFSKLPLEVSSDGGQGLSAADNSRQARLLVISLYINSLGWHLDPATKRGSTGGAVRTLVDERQHAF